MKRIILVLSVLLVITVVVIVLNLNNPTVIAKILQKSVSGQSEPSVRELGNVARENKSSGKASLSKQEAGQRANDVSSVGDKTQSSSDTGEASKYDDYEFNFKLGRAIAGPEVETRKNLDVWPHEELFEITENFYNFKHETRRLRIWPWAKVSEKLYVGGGAPSSRQTRGKPELMSDNIPIDQKLLNCDWPGPKVNEDQVCSMVFVGVFNIEKQTVTRIKDSLYNSKTQSWQKRDIINVRDGIVTTNKEIYYGCYPNYPINTADINLDGMNEIMLISSTGHDDRFIAQTSGALSTEPEHAEATLYVSFVSATAPDPYLLDTELVYNKYDYQKFQGKRRYAKLFFGDFDEDEKLDILIWRRYFDVVPKEDGYGSVNKMSQEAFEHYEEASPSYEKQPISNEEGHTLLKEHNWGWFDGFPSKNLCIAKDPWRHYAKPEIMQHGSIPTD